MGKKKEKIEIIIDKIKVCFWEHEDFDDIRVREILEQELNRAREEEKKNIFTEEELRYLLEIIQLDYSLATMYQQREKSDIGGKLLRELSKLTTK